MKGAGVVFGWVGEGERSAYVVGRKGKGKEEGKGEEEVLMGCSEGGTKE